MEENDKGQTTGPIEAPPDFETRPELAPVIDRMRGEPTQEPAPEFTRRVMASISAVQSEMDEAATAARQMKQRAASLMRYLTDTPAVSDIALCFLLSGFFYFLLGVIFFLGLLSLEPLPATAGWLRLQPPVAMLTAGVLGTIGLLLLLVGQTALRLAQIAVMVFIAFSFFNGMWISLENTGRITPIGLVCFTAAPVLLGLFLAASLLRYRRQVMAG